MNLSQFENNVRAGLAPTPEPDHLNASIDRQILTARHRQIVGRRFKSVAAATLVVAAGFLVVPVVRAESRLRQIAGALDGVTSVVMTSEIITTDGTRYPSGSTAYSNGQWRVDHPGYGLILFSKGVRYRFDPVTKCYISETGLTGPFAHNSSSMRLSDLLKEVGSWQPGQKIQIDENSQFDGSPAIRAVVEDGHGRMTVYANTKSQLPIEIDQESKTSGTWRQVSDMRFDYSAKLDPKSFEPDTAKYPVLPVGEWTARVVKSLTSDEVAVTPLQSGRLVVRAIDVAKDGTVYIAYQAGQRIANWNRGYALEVSDNLGTEYCFCDVQQRLGPDGLDPSFIRLSKDGKLELGVFIPVGPVQAWAPRTITIGTRLGPGHELRRWQPAWGMSREGVLLGAFWYLDRDKPSTLKSMISKTFAEPTCSDRPAYADLLSYSFGPQTELAKIKSRADYFYNAKDFAAEEAQLVKEQTVLRELRAQGIDGPGPETVQARLDEARSKAGRPQ